MLKLITASQQHLTLAAIYERLQQGHLGIGLITIYRTLGIPAELRVCCDVNTESSSRSYFIKRVPERHHHLICSACGATTDFTTCDLKRLEQRLSRKIDFKMDDTFLDLPAAARSARGQP